MMKWCDYGRYRARGLSEAILIDSRSEAPLEAKTLAECALIQLKRLSEKLREIEKVTSPLKAIAREIRASKFRHFTDLSLCDYSATVTVAA